MSETHKKQFKGDILGYIIFNDSDDNPGFKIKSMYLTEKQTDKILNYLRDKDDDFKSMIDEYIEIRKREKELNKKRKEILKKIKEKYNDEKIREEIINKNPDFFV